MADNYLERRMEDYLAGRLARPSHRKAQPKAPAAETTAVLDGHRVLILSPSASASAQARALIALMRGAGCRVAFTDTDSSHGRELANATGAQCHPIDFRNAEALSRSRDIIRRRWGGIDITITLTDNPAEG